MYFTEISPSMRSDDPEGYFTKHSLIPFLQCKRNYCANSGFLDLKAKMNQNFSYSLLLDGPPYFTRSRGGVFKNANLSLAYIIRNP